LMNYPVIPAPAKHIGKVYAAQVAWEPHPLARTSSRTRCSRREGGFSALSKK
jgi:hypothetical protein